jgi:DNA repair protein RadC
VSTTAPPPVRTGTAPDDLTGRTGVAPDGVGPSTPTWRHGPASGTHPGAEACAACSPRSFRPGDLDRPAVTSPEAAAELVVPALADRDRERCVAVLLDTKHRLIERVTVSIGSVDHTFMAPREVYRDALVANASALVLAHNHPSGDPEPSTDDELLTRRLARAGELVGVDLLDHLVVGAGRWVSLARRGLL